jgi:hypothetical protein
MEEPILMWNDTLQELKPMQKAACDEDKHHEVQRDSSTKIGGKLWRSCNLLEEVH